MITREIHIYDMNLCRSSVLVNAYLRLFDERHEYLHLYILHKNAQLEVILLCYTLVCKTFNCMPTQACSHVFLIPKCYNDSHYEYK